MGEEQRKQYRVTARDAAEVSVAVLHPQDGRTSGQASDLSIGGMGILFDPALAPIYKVGENVQLEVTCPPLEEPLVLPALVHHRMEGDAGRKYGFKFADWNQVRSTLPAQLASYFNRRRDWRFEPDPENPVAVKVEGEEKSFMVKALLRDLSGGGLSFRAAPFAEIALSKVPRILVSFHLPRTRDLLTFCAVICHRELTSDSICYGVRFREEETEDFQEQQESITTFMTELQEETLRSLR